MLPSRLPRPLRLFLYAVASAVDEDEELRKAAYRAARRGRRYQEKRSEKREVAS